MSRILRLAVYKLQLSQWLLLTCCLGLQHIAAASPSLNLSPFPKPLPNHPKTTHLILPSVSSVSSVVRQKNSFSGFAIIPIGFFSMAFHTPLIKGGAIKEYVSNLNPIGITHLPISLNQTQSPKCPTEVENLTPLMLKDLPSYANRIMQRSRRLSRNTGSMSYVIAAGRPEFEPLTLGPGEYTPPTSSVDLEPPKQVFFTTLERQYRGGKASYLQLYHWLFLTQTTDGWRVAMMFSQIGTSGHPPTPPLESSKGVVGQAVKVWLRDCRAGVIRSSTPRLIPNPKSTGSSVPIFVSAPPK